MTNTRNPYQIDGEAPKLRKSVFVLMDILGYSEMIRQAEISGTQQLVLNKLHQALVNGRQWLEDSHITPELRNLSTKDPYALKAFTDNIVIGWPIRDDAESEFGNAFFNLAAFQLQMVSEGFFIRGAISIGEAYIDEIAVFGNALSDAYLGETTLARDPRIILTSPAVKTIKTHLTYYHPPSYAPQVRDLLRDSDGQWFLNYLECVLIAEHENGPFYGELIKHKNAVQKKLTEHKDNPTIWSKYAWVAGYHNFFCDLHPSYFSDEHKINVDLFRASPSLIVEE